MNIANTIEVLKRLLKINNDRAEDYRKAGAGAKQADLKPVFQGIADESRKNITQLEGEIKKQGGESEAFNATPEGKILLAWIDFKAAFTGRDRDSVLASVEQGYNKAHQGYQDAIASNDLSSEIRQLVRNQNVGLENAHNRLKDLKDNPPAK